MNTSSIYQSRVHDTMRRMTSWTTSRRPCRCICTSSSHRSNESKYPSPLPFSALKSRAPPKRGSENGSSSHMTTQELASSLVAQISSSQGLAKRRQDTLREVERDQTVRHLEMQAKRIWRAGDVYAPHDLSPIEQAKWNKRKSIDTDAFDTLGLDPLAEWKNVSILESFRTPLGRIMHREDTGLRAVNQRKISKAVRRAVGMGMIPSVHKHPEILEVEERKRNERRFGLDGRRGIFKQ